MSLRSRLPQPVKDAGRGAIRFGATLTGPARRLPDYLIVGAQKAGTTSLYDYLVEHPDVLPAATKEVHYFDLHYRKGVNWYRGHFPPRARGGPNAVTGEASPYYLFHPHTPRRAAELLPDAKLIVLLRHPVDRAYSAHNHELTLGNETLPFEEAIEREPERLAGELERLEAEPLYWSYAWGHHAYLERSRYASQIRRWLACFPREQFLFLRAEDLFADPATVYAKTLDFLGLEPYAGVRFTARNARRYSPIEPALWDQLCERFARDNAELYELLGEDFGWEAKRPPPEAVRG